MSDPVLQELARARERLLDLTLRNRLLNFRPTKRTTIAVVDELPAQVWRLMVEEGRKLAFLAREEHELFEEAPAPSGAAVDAPPRYWEEAEEDDSEEPENPLAQPDVRTALEDGQQQLPPRYTDLFLQTPLNGADLQTNLIRIERQARSFVEERGVNLLFVAMGFLYWRPEEGSDRTVRAPLVLVPAALERSSVKRRYKLRVLADEPIVNPCLWQKLRDLRIELPDTPDSWDGFDVEQFLADVGRAVADQPGWRVAEEIHLGFFSFVKYLMYVDLDGRRWPAGRPLADGALIRTVCGDGGAVARGPAEPPQPVKLDETLAPEESFQVLDADSSQQEAILAAKRGASLVIEGPPGTGKSQTIANIIAECLADGRTVLFVSEKLAALEVVKRRLDRLGLGDFCLELHSAKANRRAVTAELGCVLEKGRYRANHSPDGAQKLARLRGRLNGYVAAVHEQLGPIGLSVYDAIGRVALLADVPDVFCDVPGHEQLPREQLEAMKEKLDQLTRRLRQVGPPEESLWRGSRVTAAPAGAQRSVAESCRELARSLDAAGEAAAIVAGLLGVAAPATGRETAGLLASAELIVTSPTPAARLAEGGLWDRVDEELAGLLSKVRRLAETQGWMEGKYRPETLDAADWGPIAERCRAYWQSWLRWLRPTYWSDRGAVKRYRLPGHRPAATELAAELRRLAEAQSVRDALASGDELGVKYFDQAWRGGSSDWRQLAGLADWLTQFRTRVKAGRIGPGGMALAAAGADRGPLAAAAKELADRLAAWEQAWGRLIELLVADDPGLFDVESARVGVDELRGRLERMAEEVESLLDWARYQEVLQDCQAGPLAAFVVAAADKQLEPEVLALAMEKQVLRLLIERALAEREALRQFSAGDHEADILSFVQLDREWIARTATRLHGLLASQRPGGIDRAAGTSQLGILQGEIRRKRGGRPIRRLMTDAADVIAKLKPCFMMSPLSVAQFLAPEGMRFDVVVFDEASQVEPADALGAVARGGQLILVGDPKQLPPTPFFTTAAEVESAAQAGEAAGLVDMESILDRGATVLPTRRLRWHYRSRHESLIAYSNHAFYNDDLVTFPSCHTDTSEMGLSLLYEPGDAYGRGRGQTNRGQARRIAARVFEHARRRPELSLGVGAFSQRQQQSILDEIEKLRREDDSLEAFFERNKPEPFFVKNIETIQGDERDVILLSVGYGKADPAERLSMNFGPLNQDGGWRRLNVLITRARRRCVVFTSILGEDFDLAATQARGVHALKGYLDFARSGELPAVEHGDGQFDSPLEEAVYNALTEHDVRLHCQVGCAGYAIDLAVVDDQRPGKYVLGIECDGASYHGCATARDRDRTRQQVLESLGWRIHRIWSTEWFRSPQREIAKALEAIRLARDGQLKPRFLDDPSAGPPAAAESFTPVEGQLTVPAYELYRSRKARAAEEFYSAGAVKLAELIGQIVDAEGPVHRSEVSRRVRSVYGLSRGGNRIEEKIGRAVESAGSRELVVARDEFLWPRGMAEPPVRCRGDADQTVRDIELICPEEIARAARLLLEVQFGMGRDDLVSQTARLLGFQHTGSRIQERIDGAITAELQAGRIAADGDLLRVAE